MELQLIFTGEDFLAFSSSSISDRLWRGSPIPKRAEDRERERNCVCFLAFGCVGSGSDRRWLCPACEASRSSSATFGIARTKSRRGFALTRSSATSVLASRMKRFVFVSLSLSLSRNSRVLVSPVLASFGDEISCLFFNQVRSEVRWIYVYSFQFGDCAIFGSFFD